MNPRLFLATVLLAVLACLSPVRADVFNWNQWHELPVQDGGRYKPLDTLGWETLRTLANRGHMIDPDTGQQLDPATLYLVMLLEWRGWDRNRPSASQDVPGPSSYFKLHQADKWDRAPLLRVDYLDLRVALGMPRDEKYIAPAQISLAKIKLPGLNEEHPFLRWAEQARDSQSEGQAEFKRKAVELADRYWLYVEHRMGNRLKLLPNPAGSEETWLSFAELWHNEFTAASDPDGTLRKAQQQLRAARQAYFGGSAGDFNQASAAALDAVRAAGPELGNYPATRRIGLEVTYNRWAPFRFAWVLMLLALIGLLLAAGTRWRPFVWSGWTAFAGGMLAMLVGFAMRVMISGRAPVTNMYESVIFVGAGVAIFGAIFEMIYRKHFVLTAAAAVATVAFVLADNCPAALDPSFRPLQPVLRSNFWLVTHVMTITLSYAAFALALGIGNIALGFFLAGKDNPTVINQLTNFTYRAMQVGVLLLAAGTILGGVWADYSWGRFWGWDPKEVWALIALLGYLAILHARFAGWVRQFGLAALSVICFSLVVMAWYGVNFVLGVGLHSYGFGGGGQPYIFAAILIQSCYVAAAGVRYLQNRPAVAEPANGPRPAHSRTTTIAGRQPAT